MNTQSCIAFGRVKAGYNKINENKPLRRINGTLYLDDKSVDFFHDKPFPILQKEKTRLIESGINKNRLKIKYK